MKQILFIVNPRSGKEQIRNSLADILGLFTGAGYITKVLITQKSSDCTEWVKEYGSQADLIVCSGGDGTLNEAINGIMALEDAPPLGYIPAGSTNDYAVSLGLSRQPRQAAADILAGLPWEADVGWFEMERYFAYVAGFGIFTEIPYITSQDKKNWLGYNAYMLESVKSLASLKPVSMRVEWEDQVLEEEFIFGMVTNSFSVGGFKGLVHQPVTLDDGFFEVLLIRMPKTPIDLTNIISYMFLKAEPNEYVYRFQTKRIRMIAQEPIDWVLDGEFGGSRQDVTIANLQKRLKIVRRLPE